MKTNPTQLRTQLNNKLQAVYYVCGDEPLLVQESCDAIRATAKKNGFSERERFDTGTGFNLESLQTSQSSLSLFAEKKIIELHLYQSPNKALQDYLLEHLQQTNDDTILLIASKRFTNAAKQAWYKTIEKQAIIVECWPIKSEQLPQWLAKRLKTAGFQADRDVVNYLASLSEGNLLATKQNIEKLQLLCQPGELTLATVVDAVQDSARFDVFQLADSALQGNAKRCGKILEQLKTDGTASTLALWALTREIRTVLKLSCNVKTYIFPSKKSLYQASSRRLAKKQLEDLLAKASQIDLMIKGLKPGNPWDELFDICVAMA